MKMRESENVEPPRWADRLLSWYCRPEALEDLQGDLHELFARHKDHRGVAVARLYYILDVLSFMRPYIIKTKHASYRKTNYRMMFNNYFKTTYRYIQREPRYFIVNVLGLALGIGSSLILFSYNFSELTFDRHHQFADRIYRISVSTEIDGDYTEFAASPPALGLAMAHDLAAIIEMARLKFMGYPFIVIKSGDNVFKEKQVFMADSNSFKIFTYPLVAGDKNPLEKRFSIVLSETLSTKIFGKPASRASNPVGKTVKINDHEFTVTAIMKDLPFNDHLQPNALISWHTGGGDDIWDDSHAYTYALLPENHDYPEFIVKAEEFFNNNANIISVQERFGAKAGLILQPLLKIHFDSKKQYEIKSGGNPSYLYAFFVIGLFFLISSGINYTNLAMAASSYRYKEIGVRKVLGAKSGQVQKQFLTEATLLVIVASIAGIILMLLAIPFFNQLMDYRLTVSNLLQPGFLLIGAGSFILLILLSGFYPAFYLSRFNPVYIFKTKLGTKAGNVIFRKTLIVLQFSIAVVMVFATLLVTAQMRFINNKELGFNKENVVIVSIPGNMAQNFSAFENRLRQNPHIHGTATCDYIPGYSMIDEHKIERENGEMRSRTVARLHFDEDFIDLLDLKVVKGRSFNSGSAADFNGAYLVNETAVKAFGWDKTEDGPIGKRINGFNYGKSGKVIGVVKDAFLFSLRSPVAPVVMGYSGKKFYWGESMYIKIDGETTDESVSFIEKAYRDLFPGTAFEYSFLDDRFQRLYDADIKMSATLTIGAYLMIFIACLGLFGLSAFMAMQRTKEIGIRKILGASVTSLMTLLSGDFLKLILIANIFALPAAYLSLNSWLDNYAFKAPLGWWFFAIPVVLVFFIALLSLSFQTFKAARKDPVDTLRYE